MFKESAMGCKIVGIFAAVGALNWGLIGLTGTNFVSMIFGEGMLTRIIYILVGFSGLMLLLKMFGLCPKCNK